MDDDAMFSALGELDARKKALPTHCPSWCVAGHVQALEEGCPVEQARVHLSSDVVGRTRGGLHWGAWLTEETNVLAQPSGALLTEADLARRLSATTRQVAEWRRQFDWSHQRFGRAVRYTADQVEQILHDHEHKPSSADVIELVGQTKLSSARNSS